MIRIGIDFDNTLASLVAPWLDRINRFHGTNFPISAWDEWDATNLPSHVRATINDFISPDIYNDVKPYDGAQETIERLIAEDFSILCITANPPFLRQEFEVAKIKWIKKHFPPLDGKVLFQDNKSNAPVDILIDDKPENLSDGAFIPVVFHQPWNQSFPCTLRIHSWGQAMPIIAAAVQQASSFSVLQS